MQLILVMTLKYFSDSVAICRNILKTFYKLTLTSCKVRKAQDVLNDKAQY